MRGEPGHAIIPELAPAGGGGRGGGDRGEGEGEPVIDKPGRSAFRHTDFKLLLDVRGVRNLVVCGVTTDVCVSSTVRDANDLGLDCVVVGDACAAGSAELHEAALESIKGEGGIFGAVTETRHVLEALGAEELSI